MKTILKFTKYLFIMVLLSILIIICVFIYFSKKINYDIPRRIEVQIYDNSGNQYLSLNNQNKQSYSYLHEISPYVIDSIISIEDKKFYQHKGIDLIRIGGALTKNIKENEIREGASTITQQYARILYLNTEKN